MSSCAHAALTLLYPLQWQHIFIPVLPKSKFSYAAAPMMEEAASAEADAAPPPPADVVDVDALWAHLMAAAFADGRTGEELGEPYAGVELVRHEPIALDPSRASRQPVGPSGISFSVAAPSQQQFISLRLLSHDEAMHARIIDAKIHPPEARAQLGAQFSARNSLGAIRRNSL